MLSTTKDSVSYGLGAEHRRAVLALAERASRQLAPLRWGAERHQRLAGLLLGALLGDTEEEWGPALRKLGELAAARGIRVAALLDLIDGAAAAAMRVQQSRIAPEAEPFAGVELVQLAGEMTSAVVLGYEAAVFSSSPPRRDL